MQRRGVLTQRDDVLVRRLRVVLRGGAEESEVQLQLRPLGAPEELPQLSVPASRPPIGLGEAFDFIRRLENAQLVQLEQQRRWIGRHGLDAQRLRRAHIVAHEGDAAAR